ncbi:uncharacterized protein MYCFIDRAFT_208411 [Pseudocercospora fijiensis CIRAD86]|uniref:Uncharacterized protein n=1 Tax=Pseudocercospora fijiensis (strain CIRAD86) TaxID=383855 RepID=M2YQA8_PSEFD|nr:uncharacterized protein MYCFIDRAFT_208411 [Pseudocercospora fijiensis CIRAD86]EME79905.1 hypothetical protein MYCFIDRAFT_208411 [Pseudocercospora fijiensis CIRAD86]
MWCVLRKDGTVLQELKPLKRNSEDLEPVVLVNVRVLIHTIARETEAQIEMKVVSSISLNDFLHISMELSLAEGMDCNDRSRAGFKDCLHKWTVRVAPSSFLNEATYLSSAGKQSQLILRKLDSFIQSSLALQALDLTCFPHTYECLHVLKLSMMYRISKVALIHLDAMPRASCTTCLGNGPRPAPTSIINFRETSNAVSLIDLEDQPIMFRHFSETKSSDGRQKRSQATRILTGAFFLDSVTLAISHAAPFFPYLSFCRRPKSVVQVREVADEADDTMSANNDRGVSIVTVARSSCRPAVLTSGIPLADLRAERIRLIVYLFARHDVQVGETLAVVVKIVGMYPSFLNPIIQRKKSRPIKFHIIPSHLIDTNIHLRFFVSYSDRQNESVVFFEKNVTLPCRERKHFYKRNNIHRIRKKQDRRKLKKKATRYSRVFEYRTEPLAKADNKTRIWVLIRKWKSCIRVSRSDKDQPRRDLLWATSGAGVPLLSQFSFLSLRVKIPMLHPISGSILFELREKMHPVR